MASAPPPLLMEIADQVRDDAVGKPVANSQLPEATEQLNN